MSIVKIYITTYIYIYTYIERDMPERIALGINNRVGKRECEKDTSGQALSGTCRLEMDNDHLSTDLVRRSAYLTYIYICK